MTTPHVDRIALKSRIAALAQAAGRTARRWLTHVRGNRAVRWRRRGMILPTPFAIILVLAGCGLWIMALALDDRAIMACALAVLTLLCCALVLLGLQWLVVRNGLADTVRQDRRSQVLRNRVSDARSVSPSHQDHRHQGFPPALIGLLGPRAMSRARLIEQLDADGVVINRFTDREPLERGWYRCRAHSVSWIDPFGLFKARCVRAADDQWVVLPHAQVSSHGGARTSDRGVTGSHSQTQSGTVRDYVVGDPPKMISWSQTAHHGSLMTRERTGETMASILLVLDTAVAQPSELDVEVREALECIGRFGRQRRRIAVTDGLHGPAAGSDMLRLFGAVRPVPDDGPVRQMDDLGSDAASPSPQPGSRVAGIVDAAEGMRAADPAPLRLIIVTADADSPLVAQLKSSRSIAQSPAVIMVGDAAPLSYDRIGVTGAEGSLPSAGDRRRRGLDPQSQLQGVLYQNDSYQDHPYDADPYEDNDSHPRDPEGNGPGSGTPHNRRPPTGRSVALRGWSRAEFVGAILRIIALLTFFEIAIRAADSLIETNGTWPWFARVALACVTIGANIPWSTVLRGTFRALVTSVVILVVGVALSMDKAHSLLAQQVVISRSEDADESWIAGFTGLLHDYWTVLSQGAFDLSTQLPPLRVSSAADTVLIVGVALIAVIARTLLQFRSLTPAFALLPVTVLAAHYAVLGQQVQWSLIIAVLLAFALAAWAVQPGRALPITPLVASCVAVGLAVAGTPAALGYAYGVQISIGEPAGVFSSSTINPVVDLKRSLSTGSDSTVLRYRASERTYLRMTTLDDFDGESWSFDRSLAYEGGFYGSGLMLGDDGNADLFADSYRSENTSDSWGPLFSYASLSGDQSMLGPYVVSARMEIADLTTRFLPVAGIPLSTRGLSNDWLGYGDGSVYSRQQTTSSGLRYTTQGIDLQPIRSTSRFNQVESIHELEEGLLDRSLTSGPSGTSERSVTRTANILDELRRNETAIHERYTSLPDSLPKRVQGLVDEARQQGISTSGEDYEAQIAAMRYLVDYFTDASNGFSYSLDAPDGNGRNNMQVVNDFLDTRAGYCVHYASALAVLGRAMGVPTRMVMGYNQGVGPADSDGEFTVAAKQLHAWVEAYIDGVGWVPFDVTPATTQNGTAMDSSSQASTSTEPSTDTSSASSEQSSSSEETTSSPSQSTSTSNSAETQQRDAERSNTQAAGWLSWVSTLVWVVLGLGVLLLLLALPHLIRRSRRAGRRRLLAAATLIPDDAERAAAAWRAAWQELCDTAWDAGVRWNLNDTDSVVCEHIDAWCTRHMSGVNAANAAALAKELCDQAQHAAFSDSSSEPVGDLPQRFESVIAAIEKAMYLGEPLHRAWARYWPASLRRKPQPH